MCFKAEFWSIRRGDERLDVVFGFVSKHGDCIGIAGHGARGVRWVAGMVKAYAGR